ncbi:MAG TPA: apolipoprotein N-acyltransferase [Kiloniellales bacterium]|nr:apolipoprotein N-acyltransferase [Kiloniellales bacterium]
MNRAIDAGAGPARSALGRLAARLAAIGGTRRLLMAGALGLLSSTAFAPLWLLPLLVPAFVGLSWLLDGAGRGRSAFAIGWAFGSGHFLGGLYWVGIAMTVDFARFWWFMPVSVGGLAFGLALFIGAATWLAWRTGARGAARLLFLAVAWLVMEWLRSWVLSGFPWNQLGSVWAFAALPMQAASVVGIWGLTLLTLLAAASPALLGEANLRRGEAAATVVATWLLLALMLGYGALRLSVAPPLGESAIPGVSVRLVQPSVDQSEKGKRSMALRHRQQLIELSAAPGLEKVALLVWPETALFADLANDRAVRDELGAWLPDQVTLITGAYRTEGAERTFNSLYALDGRGGVLGVYDKAHLVPFGEYVPLRETLGAMSIPVTQGSFESGSGLATLQLPGLPAASPLICYEVIFSGAVVAHGARPGFLLNITNDAWFGRSSGPFQHFAQARLRAVEEGLPIIRSANNGISAIVDAYGRVVAKLPLDAVGVLDGDLPASSDTITIYAVMGDLILVPLSIVPAIVGYLLVRRNRQASRMLDNR